MSKFFDLEDLVVRIKPSTLLIYPYSEIWKRDKSRDKSQAFKELQYIFFMLDYESPYIDLNEEERIKQIKEYSIRDSKFNPDKLVLEGIETYKKANISPAMEMLEATNIAIQSTKDYLKGVDYTLMDARGNFLYEIDKVQNAVIKMPKMIEALNQAKELCKKELSSSNRVRGGASVGLFEND